MLKPSRNIPRGLRPEAAFFFAIGVNVSHDLACDGAGELKDGVISNETLKEEM